MKAALIVFAVISIMLSFSGAVSAAAGHADLTAYEGTKSCTACHDKSAREVAESLHYQQVAEPKFLKDWPAGKPAGMMVSY